jgi:alpha-amylase
MSAAFAASLDGAALSKTIALAGRTLHVTWRLSAPAGGRFGTELNLAMPSCDGYSGRYILADGAIPAGFGQPLRLDGAARLTLDDRELRGGLRLSASVPVAIEAAPHCTVSQSEAGFERIMQAACIRLAWPADAAHREVTVSLEIVAD